MKETNTKQFERLIEQARAYQVDTSRTEFAFETRLMANIAQLRSGDMGEGAAFLSVFTTWIWRSAMGLTPVVVLAVLFCTLWFGLSLPSDTHAFLNHVTGYLPNKPF
ncbi:MAG: hypothetical protein L3J39_02375 [Verrucomicrobiales bacterium]|nr:hypothetical protein [Verrucomicrobiales bacterium]